METQLLQAEDSSAKSMMRRPRAVSRDSVTPMDIWQYLKTYLVVTLGELLLASSGWRPGTPLKVFQCQGQSPPQRVLQPQMPTVPRWTDPGLESPIAEESSLNTWMSWSHFLEDYGKQHLKENLFLPARATVGSVLDRTDIPSLLRTTQIF